MKKKLVLASILSILILGIFTLFYVVEKEEIDNPNGGCVAPVLSEIGKIKRNNTVVVNGKKIYIFCSFENQKKALKNIKKACSKLLSLMESFYHYDEMSSTNYKKYRDSLGSFSKKAMDEGLGGEYYQLQIFFDIYQNHEFNQEIKAYMKKHKNEYLLDKEEFLNMLPYTTSDELKGEK